MRRVVVIFTLVVLTLIFYPLAFADEAVDMKDNAENQALQEEAMRQAFQDAAINDFSDKSETSLFNNKFLSRLHPYLGVNLIYSDNVYETNSNIQSDLYTEINPGIKLILGNSKGGFETQNINQNLVLDLGVDINHSFYRSAALNFEAPYAGLAYALESRNNLVSLKQLFRSDYELVSNISAGANGITHYQSNITSLLWEHRFNTLGVGLGYDRTSKDYYGIYKQTNTYVDNMGSVTGFWALTHKTRIFMEYDFGFYDYPRAVNSNDNFNYYQIWAGARGELTNKIKGLVKIGSESREYKTSPKTSMERMAVEVDLNYKQSPKNSFLLSLYRGLLNTDYVSQGADDGYGFSLGFAHNFSSKLSFNASVGYEEDEYQSGTITKTTLASLGLRYAFRKWVKMELKYDFNNRAANNEINEFKVNRYSLLAKMEF